MELDRRDFLKGAALAGGTVALAGLAGCTSSGTGTAGSTSAAKGGTLYTAYPNPDGIGTVHDTSNQETADVVVVGSGVTGLSCSMLIAEQAPDAKVLLIDKMPSPGGNTNFAEINAPDLGMPWDEALAAGIKMSNSQMGLTDAYLYANFYYDKGRMSTWYFTKHGVELASDNFHHKGWAGASAVQNLVGQIGSDEAYRNLELRVGTQAIALLMDDDHTCTGIQVKDASSGIYTNINAKAVMLATGGMGTNKELLSYYTGQDVAEKGTEYGQGQDGDGHLMVEYTAHGQSKNVDPTSGWILVKGMDMSSPLNCAAAMQAANVFVNQTGTRFNNEDYSLAGPLTNGHNIRQQGKVFSIMGKGLIDYFQAGGSDHAGFYYYQTPTDLTGELGTISSNPNVIQANTFEALAQLVGVPVDAFVDEMAVYDADAKADTGDSKFGKDAKYMVPFGDGPYYAFDCSAVPVIQTNNGIRINTDCQVVDPYYVPIVGLYAGGIAVSGFNTCMLNLGTSQSVGLWSGCKAARAIVENDLGGAVADDWFGDKEYDGPMPDFAHMELNKPLPGASDLAI